MLTAFGLVPDDFEMRPAMHPQYNLRVKEENKANEFEQLLQSVVVNGQPLIYRRKESGFFSINLGHRNMQEEWILIGEKQVSFAELGLFNEPIDDESDGTAYHIPEGVLLVYDPQNLPKKQERVRANSKAVLPSILENYGIPVPAYMTDERISAI